MAPSNFSWHYKVSEDEFMPLPEAASDDLEDAYADWVRRSSPNQLVLLKSGTNHYEVNFPSMMQRNVSTFRTRELVRKETRVGQELTRCEALLQHEQQANANLKRAMAEKSKEFEREKSDATEACERQREQLEAAQARLRTWEKERADLQTTLASSQKQANKCEARAQQLKALLVQQQQAALTSDGKLREARAELERLGAAAESHCTETAQLRAELEALRCGGTNQWQFMNHLNQWQPYPTDTDRDMDALLQQWREEGQPNKVYRLSDRYEVNFTELWQENVKHGKRRPIRQQLGTVLEERDGEAAADVRTGLESQLADKEEELVALRGQLQQQQERARKEQAGALAELRAELGSCLEAAEEETKIVRKQLQEKQEQLVELDSRLAGQEREQALMMRLRDRLQEKQEQAEMLMRSKKEQEVQLASLEAEILAKNQESARLEQEIGRLCEQARGAELAKKELAAARKQLQEKQEQLAELESRFADKEQEKQDHDLQRTRLRDRLQKKQEELEELKLRLASTEEQTSELRKEHHQLQGLAGRVQGLESDLQRFQTQQQEDKNELKERDKRIEDLSASLGVAEAAADTAKTEVKTALKKATEANAAKESAKERQVQGQKELKEKSAQLKRLQEQHALLAASVLTSEYRSLMQARMVSSLSREDDDLLRRTDADLVDVEAKKMLEESAKMRKHILNLSPTIIDVLGELREPDSSQEVGESSTPLDPGSADFSLIEHLFQRSLAKHRLNYRSQEWCEKPKLRIVSIELLTMAPRQVKLYRNERERIGKRDLPETPFPMNGAVKPLVAKDANEFMLFHGCPWESVASISSQGFDWKFRGTHQGCMFGQGVYFGANASKCDGYSDWDAEGQKCMFLARVLLGASVPRWRNCPHTKSLGKDRDSVCAATREFGGVVDHPEVCIMQKAQALPAAKIVYVHEDDCACHKCRAAVPG